jgi:hypothetical protein
MYEGRTGTRFTRHTHFSMTIMTRHKVTRTLLFYSLPAQTDTFIVTVHGSTTFPIAIAVSVVLVQS